MQFSRPPDIKSAVDVQSLQADAYIREKQDEQVENLNAAPWKNLRKLVGTEVISTPRPGRILQVKLKHFQHVSTRKRVASFSDKSYISSTARLLMFYVPEGQFLATSGFVAQIAWF